MTKILPYLCLSLLLSCVAKDQEGLPSQTFAPVSVSMEDGRQIQLVCEALMQKEGRMSVLVSTDYTYSYAEKGCDGEKLPGPSPVNVTIENSGRDYEFRKTNGELFGFPNVETYSSGVMADICGDLGHLMSPLQTSGTEAIWFTSFTSSKYCQADGKHICMHIQRGSVIGGSSYEIHTDEFIKFDVSTSRKGFFTERYLRTSAGCSSGKMEKKAVLK